MTTATKRAKVSLLSFATGSNVGADSGRSHDKKNKFKIHVTFGSRSRQNEPTLNRKVEQDSLMDQNQNQNQNWNFLLLCIYWFILGHVFFLLCSNFVQSDQVCLPSKLIFSIFKSQIKRLILTNFDWKFIKFTEESAFHSFVHTGEWWSPGGHMVSKVILLKKKTADGGDGGEKPRRCV